MSVVEANATVADTSETEPLPRIVTQLTTLTQELRDAIKAGRKEDIDRLREESENLTQRAFSELIRRSAVRQKQHGQSFCTAVNDSRVVIGRAWQALGPDYWAKH